MKDSDILGEPITGVRYNDRTYTFYPYAGRMVSPKGGLLGFIKTAKGKLHGRFYTKGQWFLFEPAPAGNEPVLAHYTVEEVVNTLLEDGFGYGQQEKPEHWTEVPYGYVAKGPDKTITAKWDGKEYRFTVDWIDDYTGQPRSMAYGSQSVDDPEAWLAKEQEKYQSAGWDFKLL